MTFPIPSWVYAALLGVLLAIGGEFHGRYAANKNFEEYKEAQAAASKALLEKREAENKAEVARHQNVIRDTKDELSQAQARLSAAYADNRRLRFKLTNSGSTAGETQAGSAEGTTGATAGTVELPQRITEGLFRLTQRADMVVEQCRAMQKVCLEK